MHENFAKVIQPNSPEARLLAEIDPERLPQHVAIIMDGNGRWARLRGKPRVFGHREGAKSVREIVDTSARLGLKAITLYAFSTENWKRPREEVGALMQMLKRFLRSELDNVHRNNIRLRVSGKIEALDDDIQAELEAAIKKTAGNTGTVLNVALNYGGRAEIVEACRKASIALQKEGRSLAELSEADIEEYLYTNGLPEVDLMIRTSGEFRISNFLLWQIAYSEIYVTPVLFPDFRRLHIFEAILNYQKRERRFGGVLAHA